MQYRYQTAFFRSLYSHELFVGVEIAPHSDMVAGLQILQLEWSLLLYIAGLVVHEHDLRSTIRLLNSETINPHGSDGSQDALTAHLTPGWL
jgi:hypothetical protein